MGTPVNGGSEEIALKIKSIPLAAFGIAVNPDDKLDFYAVRVIGAKVGLATGEAKLGVIFLDEKKYFLKNVEYSNLTFTAEIYDKQTGSAVGSFLVSRFEKNFAVFWVGELTLNGKEYYLYLYKFHVPLKIYDPELTAFKYCENSTSVECETLKSIAPQHNIKAFCEENKDDVRCKAVVAAYCLTNLEDESCKARLKEYCIKFKNDTKLCGELPSPQPVKEEQCISQCKNECKGGNLTTTKQFACLAYCKSKCVAGQPGSTEISIPDLPVSKIWGKIGGKIRD
ncbi:MAG: hypothetical protein QXQ88_00905 [archaeon]